MTWDTDEEAIEDFSDHLQMRGISSETAATYLKLLRLSSKRSDTPLIEMDISDLYELEKTLKTEYDLAESTINAYQSTWKSFFKYHGRDWWAYITYRQPNNSPHDNTDI